MDSTKPKKANGKAGKVRVSLRCGPNCDACSVRRPRSNVRQKAPTKAAKSGKRIQTTYWMTSVLILRCMAFVYLIGFSVAFFQNKALIGTNGLYPYTAVLDQYSSHHTSYWDQFVNVPTLLWFMPRSNDSMEQIALCGMLLSSLVLIFGYKLCHFSVFLSLWLLYQSLANVGGLFYGSEHDVSAAMEDNYVGGIGFESQLLETGFLAIFLCRIRWTPWRYHSGSKAKQTPPVPPSYLILLLFLWLCFRIMIGAGMIKMRAGGCWLDYTCMYYFYETQPNPTPMAWVLHNHPLWFHHFEVASNHFIELIAPWFLLVPFRKVTIGAALIQICFQFIILTSGNLSFINWMTMIPALAGLDDAFCYHYLWFLYPERERDYLYNECAKYYVEYEASVQPQKASMSYAWIKRLKCCNVYSFHDLLYKLWCVCVVVLIGYLSVDVVHNLASSKQVMNTSFDKFRLVNTYGAFGTVGKERFEVVFSMTNDEYIDEDTQWTEIVFKCKPGPLDRRPCLITPYHYRLDWQIWLAGFHPHTPNKHPWIYLFVAQLLRQDKQTIELLDESMERWMQNNNVTSIKADMFKYEFTKQWSDTNWWRREMKGSYLPPLNLQNEQFQNVLKQLSWSHNAMWEKKKRNNKLKKIEL